MNINLKKNLLDSFSNGAWYSSNILKSATLQFYVMYQLWTLSIGFAIFAAPFVVASVVFFLSQICKLCCKFQTILQCNVLIFVVLHLSENAGEKNWKKTCFETSKLKQFLIKTEKQTHKTSKNTQKKRTAKKPTIMQQTETFC